MDLKDDQILSRLEGQDEYKLYKEMLYLRSQLISPPPMTIPFFSIEAVNLETGEVEDEREGLMHTWLRNYHNKFACLFCGLEGSSTTFAAGHINVKLTDGVVYDSGNVVGFDPIQAAYADDIQGITVGRGLAAYSYEDFILDNPIVHGDANNEMLYYAMFDPIQTWVGDATRQWTSIIKRYLVNRSGASIGVTEVGFGGVSILLSRDIISPTVDIDNLKACKVTYTFVSGTWDGP